MSVDPEKTAKDAFSNPSSMTAKRLGARVSPRGISPSISDGESVRSARSRRSPSLITSAEDAEVFDQMSVSTGVALPSPKNKNKVKPTSPVEGILKHVYSLSPTSQTKSPPFPDDEEVHEQESAFSVDETEGKKNRLDFIYNDNTFHVLAEVLVDFFEKRIDDDGMIVLQPEDGEHVDRIIPESARLKFIEAVRYRLQRTPKEALTPVHLLTLKCQRLGLNKFGSKNPILAALSDSTERLLLPVLEEREDESVASSKASSEDSGSNNVSEDASEHKSGSSPENDDAVADDDREPQKITTRLSVSFAKQDEDAESPTSQQSEQNSAEVEELNIRIPLFAVGAETDGGEPSTVSTSGGLVEEPSRSETKIPPSKEESITNSSDVNMVQPNTSVEKTLTADQLQSPVSGEGGQSDASSEELIEGVGDSVTRQQLFAELREAKQFLADSVSDETKQFWEKTIEDVKQRIRSHDLALTGTTPRSPPAEAFTQQTSMPEEPILDAKEDKQPQPQPQSQPHPQPALMVQASPVDIVENNRRLLSEFHHRDLFGTPALSGSKSTASSHPISEQDYEAPMVDVVAPADLPGGYHFEAEIEGQRFLATVPPGGVQQGETFTCYMRELDSVAIDIPVGYWKDEPQDVFNYGCCHPVIWNSIFCPLSKLWRDSVCSAILSIMRLSRLTILH